MMNFDSNFEWAKAWNSYPTRCVHLTNNAYDCILNTLEEAFDVNQHLLKQLLNSKDSDTDRLDELIQYGIELKLSINELKRIGDNHE